MSTTAVSVREFCGSLLESSDLEAKLQAPRQPDGRPLEDSEPGPPLLLDRPARSPEIALTEGTGRLPKPGALSDPAARSRCLARFAHHELMAVELFAWALVRWPELPGELRRGLLHVLSEEQEHCQLYLTRLRALGSDLSEHRLSGYFWRHVPAIGASPFGVRAFLCAMGLTYEQANLDFGLLYADAFREAGDAESAAVCERVHADEIRHVRLAAVWNRRLAGAQASEIDAYAEAVPFPLAAARAKGRRFDLDARRAAGLSPEFIDYIRGARSSQQAGGGRS